MHNKLLIITISGVQDYILNATKTIDFYNGSMQIINLTKKIKTVIVEKSNLSNVEILLPFEEEKKEDEDYDVPNYLLFEMYSDECNDKVENIIRERLKTNLAKSDFLPLNVYIVCENLDQNYMDAYKRLYHRLEGFKNNRFKDLSIIQQEDNNGIDEFYKENCYICGIRKAIIKVCEDKLCYVCNKKRTFKETKKGLRKDIIYESVETIAVEEWKNKIKSKEVNKNVFLKYIENIKKIKDKEHYIDNFCHLDYKEVKNNTNFTEDLKNLNKSIGNKKASRYYCLVKADIDDLGKHFSGKYLNENYELLNFQKELSKYILNFGFKLRNSINNNANKESRKCIYSGGDDILFFSPLNKLFMFLNYIDAEVENLNRIMLGQDKYKKEITMSKSIVIAHSTIPLKKVIALSKDTLESVKNKYKYNNKNGLAVTLIDSSANIKTGYLKYSKPNIEVIRVLINKVKNEISTSLIYDLENELIKFSEDMNFIEYEIIMDIINNSINRICKKKKIKGQFIRSEEINKDIKSYERNEEKIEKLLKRLFYEFTTSNSTDYHIDTDGYLNLLKIIQKYSIEIIDELKSEGGEK